MHFKYPSVWQYDLHNRFGESRTLPSSIPNFNILVLNQQQVKQLSSKDGFYHWILEYLRNPGMSSNGMIFTDMFRIFQTKKLEICLRYQVEMTLFIQQLKINLNLNIPKSTFIPLRGHWAINIWKLQDFVTIIKVLTRPSAEGTLSFIYDVGFDQNLWQYFHFCRMDNKWPLESSSAIDMDGRGIANVWLTVMKSTSFQVMPKH